MLSLGLVGAGWVRVVFMPATDADYLTASIVMPQGTPVESTEAAIQQMEDAVESVRQEFEAETGRPLIKSVYSMVGSRAPHLSGGFAPRQQAPAASHLGGLFVELQPSEVRGIGSIDLVYLSLIHI